MATTGHVFTAAQIEAVLGIPRVTLRVWVHRGHIRKVGRDLYDGDSVIARWRESQAAQLAAQVAQQQ